MTRNLCRFVAASCLLLVSIAAAQSSKPATQKSDSDATIPPAIQTAIDALTKEMEAVLKDPKTGTRRTKCDYFLKSKETLDQDQLLDILGKRVYRNKNINQQAVIDSYVKWQLLSIMKTPFDEEHAKEARTIYTSSAMLAFPEPSNPDVSKLKEEEAPGANAKWKEELDIHFKTVGVLLDYRNELYSRLPRTIESVRAGFEDANDRMQKGYYDPKLNDKLAADLRAVAAGAKPVQIGQMVNFVQQISGKTGPKAHRDVYVSSKKTVYWRMYTPSFDKKKFDQLALDLTEMAKAGF